MFVLITEFLGKVDYCISGAFDETNLLFDAENSAWVWALNSDNKIEVYQSKFYACNQTFN